ncbi:MAG: twin-arginine translocase subunit TatC [Deltaproteobacteria bacterium]|nr:twin-arginine translocase subunit TatC [Deltaproteobacteria bacterium]
MDPNKYTLTEHLTELRARLILSLLAVIVTTVGALVFAPALLQLSTRPLTRVLEASNRVTAIVVSPTPAGQEALSAAIEKTGRAVVRAKVASLSDVKAPALAAAKAKKPIDLVFVANEALGSDGLLASDALDGVEPAPSVAYLIPTTDPTVALRLIGEDATVVVSPAKPAIMSRVVRHAAVAAGKKEKIGLAVLSPFDYFIAYLKIALVIGVFLACPVWLLQAWRFVEPGLYPHEKSFVGPIVTSGSVLFVGGGAFAYFVMFPMMFDVLVNDLMPEAVVATFTLDSYLALLMQLTLMFGIVFETPLIIAMLAMVGIVTPERLKKFRRYWVVLAFVLGGVLTPADPISQSAMAIPLIVFYEVGLWAATVLAKRRSREPSTAAEAS